MKVAKISFTGDSPIQAVGFVKSPPTEIRREFGRSDYRCCVRGFGRDAVESRFCAAAAAAAAAVAVEYKRSRVYLESR